MVAKKMIGTHGGWMNWWRSIDWFDDEKKNKSEEHLESGTCAEPGQGNSPLFCDL
jgi:hypothetical protein